MENIEQQADKIIVQSRLTVLGYGGGSFDENLKRFKQDHWADGQLSADYLKNLRESAQKNGNTKDVSALQTLEKRAKDTPLTLDKLSPEEGMAVLSAINARAPETAVANSLSADAVTLDKQNHWVDATLTDSVRERLHERYSAMMLEGAQALGGHPPLPVASRQPGPQGRGGRTV